MPLSFLENLPATPHKVRIASQRPPGGGWMRWLVIATIANLTHLALGQNMSSDSSTNPQTQPVLQKSKAGMDGANLASEERAIISQTIAKHDGDPALPLDSENSASPSAEQAIQENAPTPRRLHYSVSLSVRSVFDSNIDLTNTGEQSDFYTAIEPRLTIGFGTPEENFVALSYYPSAFIFAEHSENNALQHEFLLQGQYRFPRLTLTASQEVQLLDGTDLGSVLGSGAGYTTSSSGHVNLDVAGRTRVDVYNTHLDGNYSLTGKLFLTGGIAYSLTDYTNDALIDSSVISANAYINYIYSPKLSIGLGLNGGYDVVSSSGQDQIYEQLNLRATYGLTGKVSASATVGVEFRQFSGADGGNTVSPVLDASLSYQPFDGTNISLTLSTHTYNSATLGGENYLNTQIILGVQQRLFQRFFLGLNTGYETSNYSSAGTANSTGRDDNYFFFEPSLDFSITRFWTAGIYYLYRQSDSSLSIFSFDDTQIGARSTLTF